MKNKIDELLTWLVIAVGMAIWVLIAFVFEYARYAFVGSVLATALLCILATVSKKGVRP